MKQILLIMTAALAGCTMAGDEQAESIRAADDRRALADRLAGRVAGPAQSCVPLRTLRGNRGYGEDTIVFEGAGRTLYVNKTRSPCPRLDPWNAIRIRTIGSSLCANEPIHVFDPTTGTEFGSCSLGEFTPYRREG